MTNYNLDQHEDGVINDVIGRLETYLFTKGFTVDLGVNGRQIIADLVYQYGVKMTKQYDEIGNLSMDLNTANECLATYTKLFGDSITAQKIKSEYKRMLKREMLERQQLKGKVD